MADFVGNLFRGFVVQYPSLVDSICHSYCYSSYFVVRYVAMLVLTGTVNCMDDVNIEVHVVSYRSL